MHKNYLNRHNLLYHKIKILNNFKYIFICFTSKTINAKEKKFGATSPKTGPKRLGSYFLPFIFVVV